MSKIYYSLTSLNKILKKENPSKVCIVTSRNLAKKLRWALKELVFRNIKIIFVPDDETAKEWKQVQKILQKFISYNLDRSSIVVAFGGGVIGDCAGFAASIYLRGITYIQVPTTLLAQIDSAHGGKTGINFLHYKNQIGSIVPPLAIIIDLRFIRSLSKEEIINGVGEIVKAGLIKDPSILSLLTKEHISSIPRSPHLRSFVDKTIKVKLFYVRKDARDTHIRQLLNFGHTVGHAIELRYNIPHGRAVLIGMFEELSLGEALKVTQPSVKQNFLLLLRQLGVTVNTKMKVDWKTLLRDKKIAGNSITLPVVEKEGRSKLITLNLAILKLVLSKDNLI